jgi:hypothetical protein
VWSLKPERWGSLLVQEKYREGKACDKRNNNNNNNNNNNTAGAPRKLRNCQADSDFLSELSYNCCRRLLQDTNQNKMKYKQRQTLRTSLLLGAPARMLSTNLYDIYHCSAYSE